MGATALSKEVPLLLLQSIRVWGCAARSAGVVPSHTPTHPDRRFSLLLLHGFSSHTSFMT